MAKAHDTWTVLDHAPIEELSPRVWRVQGALPGMPLKRVMTVAKMADGKLVVHNAIALGDEAMKKLDAWGEVAFIIVPNGYHRLDAPSFAARYPNAKVFCPKGAKAKVADVVAVSGTYDDFPSDDHVSFVHLDGCKDREGVMIVKDESGATLVFNDAVFNMPDVKGVQGFVLRHFTQSSGGPRVSRIFRTFVMKDAEALASHIERLADTPNLKRVIVSHHRTIDTEPAQVLRGVAAELR